MRGCRESQVAVAGILAVGDIQVVGSQAVAGDTVTGHSTPADLDLKEKRRKFVI